MFVDHGPILGDVALAHKGTGLHRTARATQGARISAIIRRMPVAVHELARCLRAWRERLSPADAGLPGGGSRRVVGLRREEVAQLAGVSVDYLARLEQGRAISPSQSVLGSLARALRLSREERSHLFVLAGQAPPGPGTIDRHIPPGLQRMLDRLTDVPVVVVDVAWELVAVNPLASALLGDLTRVPRRERNIAWRLFTGCPSRMVRTPEEQMAAEEATVAGLRHALARHPADVELNALIDDLLRASPRFTQLWDLRPLGGAPERRKTILHPEAGPITLDCDALTVQGCDLSVVIYTAPAGSGDAAALALLQAIGLQSFSEPGLDHPSRAGVESDSGGL